MTITMISFDPGPNVNIYILTCISWILLFKQALDPAVAKSTLPEAHQVNTV